MATCTRRLQLPDDCQSKVARPGRFELPTLCLEGRRSIQLSYGRTALILGYLRLVRTLFWVNDPLLRWQAFIPDAVGKLR